MKADDLAPFTFGATDWPTIVFVNGVFSPVLSSLDALPDGVSVYDMASAFQQRRSARRAIRLEVRRVRAQRVHGAQQRVRQ